MAFTVSPSWMGGRFLAGESALEIPAEDPVREFSPNTPCSPTKRTSGGNARSSIRNWPRWNLLFSRACFHPGAGVASHPERTPQIAAAAEITVVVVFVAVDRVGLRRVVRVVVGMVVARCKGEARRRREAGRGVGAGGQRGRRVLRTFVSFCRRRGLGVRVDRSRTSAHRCPFALSRLRERVGVRSGGGGGWGALGWWGSSGPHRNRPGGLEGGREVCWAASFVTARGGGRGRLSSWGTAAHALAVESGGAGRRWRQSSSWCFGNRRCGLGQALATAADGGAGSYAPRKRTPPPSPSLGASTHSASAGSGGRRPAARSPSPVCGRGWG